MTPQKQHREMIKTGTTSCIESPKHTFMVSSPSKSSTLKSIPFACTESPKNSRKQEFTESQTLLLSDGNTSAGDEKNDSPLHLSDSHEENTHLNLSSDHVDSLHEHEILNNGQHDLHSLDDQHYNCDIKISGEDYFEHSNNSYLPFNSHLQQKIPSEIRDYNFSYSLVSIQGNRKQMQDSFGNLNFYAVFDGHGNDVIAKYLRDNLFNKIYEHPLFQTSVEAAITNSFKELDEMFCISPEFSGSGCVCVCALLINNILYVANLGDCRAVIFEREGKSRDLSFDHTPSTRKDEVDRIISQNGFFLRSGNQLRVSGELNVTRAFGDNRYKPFIIAQPEILIYDLHSLLTEFNYKDVFLVLASDGLWNDYNSKNASLLCSEGYVQFPDRALEQILEEKECYRDNITIISINIQLYYMSLLSQYNLKLSQIEQSPALCVQNS